MNRAKHLFSNLNPINFMLSGAIIFFITHMLPFLNKDMQYSLPQIAKHNIPDFGASKKVELAVTSSPIDYALIAEQNLFHPERKMTAKASEAHALPKPDFVLYGTLITDTLKLAFMDDLKSPQSTIGRGKRQRSVSLGKSLNGYILTEVFTDRVVMVKGEERVEVAVKDPAKPKRVKKS